MAFPVTTGTPTKAKTREESPNPGDLYTLTLPLLVQGVHEGTLIAEFFMRDTLPPGHPPLTDLQRALNFIRGVDSGPDPFARGPRVRWEF